MHATTSRTTFPRRTGLVLGVLAIVLAFFPAYGLVQSSASTATLAASRLTPALQELAKTSPNTTVQVLIRKTDAGTQPEQETRALGGQIIGTVPQLHLFGAQLTAGAVARLAQSSHIRAITINAEMHANDASTPDCSCPSDYTASTGATQAWAQSITGSGVAVAVLDSGITDGISDLHSRVVHEEYNSSNFSTDGQLNGNGHDQYGHGTHVAGIIAGSRANSDSEGLYAGMAPGASIVDAKAIGPTGSTTELDAIAGVFWILDHQNKLHVRVMNLSMSSSVPLSYLVDPLDAALEMAWQAGVVVVVSSGNAGPNTELSAPNNDPYVITVGAMGDNGQTNPANFSQASFSSYGTTQDGFSKPDLVAPGMHIVSTMGPDDYIAKTHPGSFISPNYFRMSGTSMASPVVAGAVALLLQAQPNLTPDQVKYDLTHTATALPGTWTEGTGAGMVNAAALISAPTPPATATQTYTHSSGLDGMGVQIATGTTNVSWSNVSWSNVSWSNVSWSNVSWSNVSWSNVAWSNGTWSDASTNDATTNTSDFSSYAFTSTGFDSTDFDTASFN